MKTPSSKARTPKKQSAPDSATQPPTTIIAEVGSVHDGSFGNAQKLIALAAECGADVVKFQTHLAEHETLQDAPMPPYFKGEPRYAYFQRTAFSPAQWRELFACATAHRIGFLSSPFSLAAVALLEDLGVAQYKIASGEVTNLPLIEEVARTGKLVYLSSGMSSWAELDRAVETVLRYHDGLVVMQCSSEYPCPYEQVGINVMREMAARYGLPVGLSDHTLTNYASFVAVTLEAAVIEKHLTFSRRMYGSDAKHSLEPAEFAELVGGVRAIEAMRRAPVEKDDLSRYTVMKETFEKSVVSVVDIPAGATITAAMVGVKKPGTGIPAARLAEVIGCRARRAIARDRLLRAQDVTGFATPQSHKARR